MMWWVLLACGGSTATPPPAPVALPAALQVQRSELHAAERDRLAEALRIATEADDLPAIAEVLAVAPAGAPFDAGAEFLEARLAERPADLAAARAGAILYENASGAASRQRWRRQATTTFARWRHGPTERATTRAAHEGVTRAIGHAALTTLLDVHVAPPTTLIEAGARRLETLELLPQPPPLGDDPHGALDALVDAAVGAGLPEPTAVAEVLEGMYEACDEWTHPIWPRQVASWQNHHEGVVPGVVGIGVEADQDGVYVHTLVEGGVAWRANVHVDDRITHIDGTPVPDDASEAAARLRGADDQPVTVGLRRGEHAFDVVLKRSSITPRTVAAWERSGPGWSPWVRPRTAFLRIQAFRPSTGEAFRRLLPPRAQLDGLVLDLRGNAGGDLDTAIALADVFIDEGPLLDVEARVRADDAPPPRAAPGSPWEGVPIVVLVDRHTGSSAEILAGLLQAHGAHVLGERTKGKGTGQLLRVDEELGFAMQITNLRWRIPGRAQLHRTDAAETWGIQPDHIDVRGPTEAFVAGVLQARREALPVHADGTPMAYRGPEVDPGLPPLDADPQIVLALQLLDRASGSL